MRALILGGTRFMGRYVSTALVEAGAEVTVANRGSRSAIPGVKSAQCDRSIAGSLEQFRNQNFDVVIDFSAYSASWVEEAAKFFSSKIDKYIFISTTAVYTSSEIFPVTENFPKGPPHPFAIYAAEKLRSEEILLAYKESGSFQTISLRLPFVLGPENYEDREAFVFSRLLENRPILLENSGKSLHSFIYAGDVATAIKEIISADEAVNGEAFNVVMSQTTTSTGFVNLAAEISGKTAQLMFYDPNDFDLSIDKFDLKNFSFPFPQTNLYFGGEKISRAIGFVPAHSLSETLDLYFKWWTNQGELKPKQYSLESEILARLRRRV